MGKKLSELTLEELWQLFPIILTEHKDYWKEWYKEEESLLKKLLSTQNIIRISHIGSTVINGIWAKPTIDILIEIPKESKISKIKNILLENSYLLMNETEDWISLNKGYTENGFAEKVFHIHLRYIGNNNELYFRDYLNEYPEIAKEYENLKLNLWKKFKHNRDAYTEAKTEFIIKYTELARKKYKERY